MLAIFNAISKKTPVKYTKLIYLILREIYLVVLPVTCCRSDKKNGNRD